MNKFYNNNLKVLSILYIFELFIFTVDFKNNFIGELWYQITFLSIHFLLFIAIVINTYLDIKFFKYKWNKIRLLIFAFTFCIWLILDLPLLINIKSVLQNLNTSFKTFKWSFSIIIIICLLINILTLIKENKKSNPKTW